MFMSSENGEVPEDYKYMARRRFYIPKSEIERYYGRQGDLDSNNVLLPVDFDEGDEFDTSEANR